MDMPDLVSIVIPCHNAEQWIAEAIRSALDQTWGRTEVIVVDDGSTDRSREVIASFGRQIVSESGPNRGGAAARNRGLGLARGRWIQFLDADDILTPDCIEQKLQIPSDPDVVPCSEAEFIGLGPMDGENAGPDCWRLREHDLDTILARGAPMTEAPLHRREDLEKVGGFRDELPCAQDFDLHLRLAAVLGLRFHSVGHAGVRVRAHQASVSRTAGWRMHYWIAESLLHATKLLEVHGQLTEERKVVIAQRVACLARKAAHLGKADKAAPLARRAMKLSPRWYENAYRNSLVATLVRILGFETYESIYRRVRRHRIHEG